MISSRKKCVLLVIDDLEYGGAQRQVIELANNLDQKQFDVHVCTLSDYVPLGGQLKDSERKLHIIQKKNKVDVTVVPRLVKLLKSLNADIIHSYLFAADIASRLAGRLAGTRLVIGTERNANYTPKKRHIHAYKMTGRLVDIIIANSKAGANFNSKTFNQPENKYRVIYNGVDTERFKAGDKAKLRDKFNISAENFIVGVFASFKPQKNHEMLLRAFHKVLETCPNARLLLVGDKLYGSMNNTDEYHTKMENIIDELKIREHCIFMGNQDNVEQLYSICDISVLSSLYEGTPNVLLESMSCGVPVVATNVCDNSYIVKNGETGILVKLNDIDAMAEAIKTLFNDSDLRTKMSQCARQWVEHEFSLLCLAKNTAKVYIEALNAKENK